MTTPSNHRGIFIVGTDTDVGKTVITVGLINALRECGIRAGVIKPVSSGCDEIDGRLVNLDTESLAKAAKLTPEEVTLYFLKEPIAPWVAAARSGTRIDLEELRSFCKSFQAKHAVGIVEGIGGLLVPIREDYLVRDLIKDLGYPAIVVARAGLGTINHTLLTIEALHHAKIPVLGFILNGLREDSENLAELTNPEALRRLSGETLLGVLPWFEDLNLAAGNLSSLTSAFKKNINMEPILNHLSA